MELKRDLKVNFYKVVIFSVTVNFLKFSQIDAQVVASMPFEDCRQDMKLSGEALKIQSVTSPTKCGLLCNHNENCRSFNLCRNNFCQLNREDVHSTGRGETILELDGDCNYFGMKKPAVPVCTNNGMFADIKNESEGQMCNTIVKKRVDTAFTYSGPSVVDIKTSTDWRKVVKREVLVEAAHGGLTDIPGASDFEVVEWLKFVHEKKSWKEARTNCENLGGKLFSGVNGTEQQLMFLYEKLNKSFGWLGIFTRDHETWVDTTDEEIDGNLLVWREGEPNNYGGLDCCVGLSKPGNTLNDYQEHAEMSSICDMA